MSRVPIIDVGQKLEAERKPPALHVSDPTPVPDRAVHAEIALTDLFSVCAPEFSAVNRIDPYWDGIWASGSSEASWVSRSLAERQVDAGLGLMPENFKMSRDEALASVAATYRWRTKLKMLGALDTWRTLSGEQLAAVVGDRAIMSSKSKLIASLFCSELIDVGVFHNMLLPVDKRERSNLFRPSRSRTFVNDIEPLLTYPEWVSITGGTPAQAGGLYDRHNLLASELGLRIAEFCEVGSVIGEKHTTVDLLAGSGLGLNVPDPDHRRADLAVLRPDGLRVAIEITASSSYGFSKKVRRWAEILQERPLEMSGLTILFVLAASPERENSKGFHERTQMYKTIAKAVREFPGRPGDRTARRMGVVSWRDWFPSKGTASADFENMRAYFPTGPRDDLWHRADLLGVNGLPMKPKNPEAIQAAVHQSHLLLGVPHWLRDASKSPQVWPVLLDRAGITTLPMSPPAIPTDPRRVLGQPSGKAMATKPPERMIIS